MGMVVDDWLSELNQQFAYYGASGKLLDDASRIGFAAAHFAGPALKWWEQVDRASVDTWAAFVDALHSRFRPVQASMFARQRLGKLKMRESHSVNQYVSAFQTTLTPITDMGEADKVHHFVNGLLVTYFGRVWEKHPKTLKEAIDAAVSVEAIVKYGRDAGVGRSSYTGSSGGSSSMSRSDPMEISNLELESFFVDEPMVPAPSTVSPASGNTALLAKLEALDQRLNALSMSGGAPPRRETQARIPGLTTEKIAEYKKGGQCFKCGQKGHMKNECTKKN
jgi:hypothetical protein